MVCVVSGKRKKQTRTQLSLTRLAKSRVAQVALLRGVLQEIAKPTLEDVSAAAEIDNALRCTLTSAGGGTGV